MDASNRVARLALRAVAALAVAVIGATGWDHASRDHARRLAADLAAMAR